MIIVGGSYQELCWEPNRRDFFGSGMRAAAALTQVCRGINFFSAVSPQEREAAFAIFDGYGITPILVEREREIRFSYYTPLSFPAIEGIHSKAESINAEGKAALVFGMIETSAAVKADAIVFDPQNPRGPLSISRDDFKSKRFAIVGNVAETRMLGNSIDIIEAARQIIVKYDADVVIIKRGAIGSIVVTKDNIEYVPVHITNRVWPLGSGDVFSAIFAWSWAHEGNTALEAAKLASLGTAYWCSKRYLPIPLQTEEINEIANPLEIDEHSEARVYLAGPFFNIGERWLVNLAREALLGLGAEVFSPLHDVGAGGTETASKDIEGLKRCNTVLALLDNCDPGTIFEVGYSKALAIPVTGFCQNVNSPDYQMISGLDIPLMEDLSSSVYNAIWAGLK